MGTINRREFLRAAAFACPALAGAANALLAVPQRKLSPEDLVVLKSKCTACGDCVATCPVEAIKLKDGIAAIDNEECIDCGVCADECPTEAIVRRKDVPASEATAKPPARKEPPAKEPAGKPIAPGEEITYTMPENWVQQPLQGTGPDIKAHYVYTLQGIPYGEMFLSCQPMTGGMTLDTLFETGLAKVRPTLPYYRALGTHKTKIDGQPTIVHDFSYRPGGSGVLAIARTYTLTAGVSLFTFFFQTVQAFAQEASAYYDQVMASVKRAGQR